MTSPPSRTTDPRRALALLASCGRARPPGPRALAIAAASDLARAFDDLGDAWAREGHPRPSITLGSSGLLAAQLAQGAPFDAFASADAASVRAAVRGGRCDPTTALVTREGVAPPRSLADLGDDRFARVALANPAHAPYGRAAVQALQAVGVWGSMRTRVVAGDNVRQALQFVQSGNADVAIVARSLAVAAGVSYVAVDASTHAPLEQTIVACPRDDQAEQARAFVRFATSPRGAEILRRSGVVVPEERAP